MLQNVTRGGGLKMGLCNACNLWDVPKLKELKSTNHCKQRSWSANVTELNGAGLPNRFLKESEIATILKSDDRMNGSLPNKTVLCKGARVMLRYNVDKYDGLVNGATGILEGFVYDHENPKQNEMPKFLKIRFDDPNVGALSRANDQIQDYTLIRVKSIKRRVNGIPYLITNFPIVVAWAITIHKSQGMTIRSKVCIDIGDSVFKNAHGLAYVALSRVTKLENLCLLGYSQDSIYCHPDIEKKMKEMKTAFPVTTSLQ